MPKRSRKGKEAARFVTLLIGPEEFGRGEVVVYSGELPRQIVHILLDCPGS